MLTKELKSLSASEKILLIEDLWDSISSKEIKVDEDERDYVKTRLKDIKSGENKSRRWEDIKTSFGR